MIKLLGITLAYSLLMLPIGNKEMYDIHTVNGIIPVNELGVCLTHEHMIVDWIGADSTGYHRWDRSTVIDRVLPYLLEVKKYGVNTIFECTPSYLGRDPLLFKELSEISGIKIITNTGYYGARNNKFIPAHAYQDSPEEIAEVWINEFNNSIEGTGIYPGFIKIGVDRSDTLSNMHRKIVKAAAIAHKATGLTIVSHTGPDMPAFAQLKILKEEKIKPEAFVWTHAQQGTIEGYIKAARMGAWISLDNINSNNINKGIDRYVDILLKMKDEELLNKILISHDAGWYNVGQENGGNFRGYTDLFEYLIPALKEKGFNQQDINLLLVQNPQAAYGINRRGYEN